MPLTRAFTLRKREHDEFNDASRSTSPSLSHRNGARHPSSPDRVAAFKRMGSVIDRSKISAPVELISTTNMLSYNAPNVDAACQPGLPASSTSSTASAAGDDSDASSPTGRSSPALTDASSVLSSPTSPQPNHLSCYFLAAQFDPLQQPAAQSPRRSITTANAHRKTLSTEYAPAIPQRALSHSKSAHVDLARKRSLRSVTTSQSHSDRSSARRVRSPPSASIRERHASADFFTATGPTKPLPPLIPDPEDAVPPHPFGKELEQLSEVVEELGSSMRAAEQHDDQDAMQQRGLGVFSAAEYLADLPPLYVAGAGDAGNTGATSPTWI